MKNLLYLTAVIVILWVTSASAATVYLKNGGKIKAKSVWKDQGKVFVLIHVDSITSFFESEINLRKTFPPRKKRVKTVNKPKVTIAPTDTQKEPPVKPEQPVKSKPKTNFGISLPSLPKKLPELAPPKSDGEGTIRKRKKEMEDKTGI